MARGLAALAVLVGPCLAQETPPDPPGAVADGAAVDGPAVEGAAQTAPSPEIGAQVDPVAGDAEGALEPTGQTPEAVAPAPDPLAIWRAALARDAQLSFRRAAGERALEDLERGDLDPVERATALFVLGLVRAGSRQFQLEEAARAGLGLERLAAILALGELELPPIGLLEGLLLDPSEEVRDAALLALLRSRDPGAVGRLGPLAAMGGPVAAKLAELTRFVVDRGSSAPTPIALLWLDLRWRAARRYGLIDGQSWRARELERLSTDPLFLDAVVLPLAAEARWLPTRDHLMALLVESPGPIAFEAALRAIPAEVGLVVRNGIWLPADEAQWRALLAAIERTGVGLEVIDVLDRALGVESLRREAALLLLATGDRRGWELVSEDLVGEDPAARAEVATALGRSGDPDWLLELQRLREDPSPRVRAVAVVARIRLGELAAFETAVRDLSGEDPEQRDALARALAEAADDVRVQTLLEQALLRVDEPLATELAIALALEGRPGARAAVREVLADGSQPQLTAQLVRALGSFADASDMDRLRRMFPSDGDLLLDLELARALVVNRDALGLQIVRSALWSRPWHEGVLAAFLMADLRGLQSLHSELVSPPPLSSNADLRRLGFALGEIGGMEEVERLALRRNSADPALQGAYLGALAARTY